MIGHGETTIPPLQVRRRNSTKGTGSRPTSRGSRKAASRPQSLSRSSSQRQPQHQPKIDQITPPLTPSTSSEDLTPSATAPVASYQFHDYLRAQYSFHPPYNPSSATITLPLNRGDVVLVHQVHGSGWADGTLLDSGMRGWLPTNYCEPYSPRGMRNLLNAMTELYEVIRNCSEGDLTVLYNQAYTRSMVAGVRVLLENTKCLSGDARLVCPQTGNAGLRRYRKGMLGELAAFLRHAEDVERSLKGEPTQSNLEGDCLDQLLLNAFKTVLRAAKFFDIWLEETSRELPPLVPPKMLDASDTKIVPPTPPADKCEFGSQASEPLSTSTSSTHATLTTSQPMEGVETSQSDLSDSKTPEAQPESTSRQFPLRKASLMHRRGPTPVQINRLSYRISLNSRTNTVSVNSASHKLTYTYERLNENLINFESISTRASTPSDVLLATGETLHAGREMLSVVDAIWDRSQQHYPLDQARDLMYRQLHTLVLDASYVFDDNSQATEDDRMSPESLQRVSDSATHCIRTANLCSSESRGVLEKCGDFEIDELAVSVSTPYHDAREFPESPGIRVPAVPTEATPTEVVLADAALSEAASMEVVPPESSSSEVAPSEATRMEVQTSELLPSEATPTDAMEVDDTESQEPCSDPSEPFEVPEFPMPAGNAPALPPLDTGSVSLGDLSPLSASTVETSESSRFSFFGASKTLTPRTPMSIITTPATECGNPLSAATSDVGAVDTPSTASFPNSVRDSSSQSVTTIESSSATSPESSFDGRLATNEAGDDLNIEKTILTQTFAHELYLGRESQVVGGSLPALVERLTTNDCTPDALFVTTFFLTFRVFTTPTEFATCLIDRFEYMQGNEKGAIPVRLRVYNVFKQWLESHWRADCDKPALEIITPFAQTRLSHALPTAGQRLAELSMKVANCHSTLVPRQIAAIGRTNTSNLQFLPADAPVPTPVFSKQEAALLQAWKYKGATPKITDFTPLEIARQLTIKASNIFCAILPEELLQREWTKAEGSIAFNVRAMTTLSNDLISFITETILVAPDPKKRAKCLKHWIKIGEKCLELNNLFVAMQIIAALSNSTVHRMNKTWENISTKNKDRLANLSKIFEPQRNKLAYRQRLAASVGPAVPFLGIHQTDLFHIDDHNRNIRPAVVSEDEGVPMSDRAIINFEKHTKTAKVISELQRFQLPYRLEEVSDLQTWIQDQLINVRTHDEVGFLVKQQAHYRRSCLLEPRDTSARDRSMTASNESIGSSFPSLR